MRTDKRPRTLQIGHYRQLRSAERIAKSRTEKQTQVFQIMNSRSAWIIYNLFIEINKECNFMKLSSAFQKLTDFLFSVLNQELPNPELIRLHATLLRCCQISKSVGVTFCRKKIFSESENAAFYGALSRNWNQEKKINKN